MRPGLDTPASSFGFRRRALVHRMTGGHILVLQEDAPLIGRHYRGGMDF